MSILILDDYAEPRQEARTALETMVAGADIQEFSDPLTAVEYFKIHPEVDLVLTDIVMPEMNGIEVARAMLEQRIVPIILHTGSWSKDFLYNLILNGTEHKLPIEIAIKQYFFASPQLYQQELQQSIERAQRKAAATTSTDLTLLDKINKKLQGRNDNLIDYVKCIYKELARDIEEMARKLPEEVRLELTKQAIDFSQTSTDLFMHNLRYPLSGLHMILSQYQQESWYPQIHSITTRMSDIAQLINAYQERYQVSIPSQIEHAKVLEARLRTALPSHDLPLKLQSRQILLADTGIPHLFLKPEQNIADYQDHVQRIAAVTGKIILRSMHSAEDGQIPLAGYFDSVPVADLHTAAGAVEKIRASVDNKSLQEFCFYRGLTLPTRAGMFIGIEPYYETQYLGAVIEHPNHEDILLTEFGYRMHRNPGDQTAKRYWILYDKNQDKILSHLVPEAVDAQKIARIAAQRYATNFEKISRAGMSVHDYSHQMEIGFDDTSFREFQMRTFKETSAAIAMSIDTPLLSRMVIGTCRGEDMVVCRTNEPEVLSLVSARAREDRLKVCYLPSPTGEGATAPNLPSYCENLGLLILDKGLAVQEHGYFNAMMAAENIVSLGQADFSLLHLESGDRIRYKSNGTNASFTKLDQTGELKYRIRELLNR